MITKQIINTIIIIVILIIIPVFCDIILKHTVRKRRHSQIIKLATDTAIKTNKSLLIFNNMTSGVIDGSYKNPPEDKNNFSGNFTEIIDKLESNSCVIVLFNVMEYVDNVQSTLDKLMDISSGDIYYTTIEQYAPRILYDYKIKQIFSKPYYKPSDNSYMQITWNNPNPSLAPIRSFYKKLTLLFKI